MKTMTFDEWCRELGTKVISLAVDSMERGKLASDQDLADLVRCACNDYNAHRVFLNVNPTPQHGDDT